MPKKLNPITECRLEQSKQYVTELIASKRKLVLEDLDDFEQRSKRYWERRLDGRETRRADPMDEDIEEELKEIMKNDELTGEEDMPDVDVDVDAEGEVDGEVMDFKVTVFTSNELNTNNDDALAITLTNHTRLNNDDLLEEATGMKEDIRKTLEQRRNSKMEVVKDEEVNEDEIECQSISKNEDEVENGSNHNEEETESRSAHSENDEPENATEENDVN